MVEALAALAILLVLIGVVILGASAVRESGRRSTAQSQLALMAQAIDQYVSFWPKWKIGGVVVAERGWPDFNGQRLFHPDVFELIDPFNNRPTFEVYYDTVGVPNDSGVVRAPPADKNLDYVGRGDVLSANICLAYALTASSGKGPYLPPDDLGVLKDITDSVVLKSLAETGDVDIILSNPLLPAYQAAPSIGAKHGQVLVDPWGTPYRYFWVYRDSAAQLGWRPVETTDLVSAAFRVAEGYVLESAGPDRRFGNLWKETPTEREFMDAADNLTLKP